MPRTKSGELISWGEFMKRWKEGIKNVAKNPTPIEKVSIELRGTFINLLGILTCLVVLIIYRNEFVVVWFSYGLILIFLGSLITVGIKFFALRQQKNFLKNINLGEILNE